MGSPYILDNARKEAADRFPALSASFDPGTIRHLEDLGVGPGWQCLEVGGGGGSIAAWLAARVAPTGHVLATDIDTRFLESLNLPNTEVRRHNIAADPLPEAAFDLVHSRLVLIHVPEREQALRRMIAALKPGGWIIDEDFDLSVFPDPAKYPGEVLTSTFAAMVRIMNDRGVDQNFGRRLFGLLRTFGLADVAAEGRTIMWTAGSAGPSLLRSNFEQLRTAMIDAGYITQQEFEEDIARLDDPTFVMPSPVMWAAWGRRA
ncbi:MAG TPA: methyltransferase domain-containing protein [Edaphobacter sp.]